MIECRLTVIINIEYEKRACSGATTEAPLAPFGKHNAYEMRLQYLSGMVRVGPRTAANLLRCYVAHFTTDRIADVTVLLLIPLLDSATSCDVEMRNSPRMQSTSLIEAELSIHRTPRRHSELAVHPRDCDNKHPDARSRQRSIPLLE